MSDGPSKPSVDGRVPQAGAIVMRATSRGAEVLLVSARRDPTQWIFPKGHIEPEESASQAALREAREEAGVITTPLATLGALEFTSGDERVHVQYFLLAFLRAEAPGEGRKVRWCRLDEARRLLSFEDARSLLAEAARAFGQR